VSDAAPVVLVVDADPATHLASEGALPETECMVMGARTAEMALKMAERRPPAVLVVDARLGGITYLTERLRRLSAHLHIVHLVASDHVVDPSQRQPGGISLLRKPFEAARFRSTLRTVLRLSAMSAGVKRMHDGSAASRRASWVGESPAARTGPDGEVRPTPVPRRESEVRPTPVPRREGEVHPTPVPRREGEAEARPAPKPRRESGVRVTPIPREDHEGDAERPTQLPRAPRVK